MQGVHGLISRDGAGKREECWFLELDENRIDPNPEDELLGKGGNNGSPFFKESVSAEHTAS